MESLSPPELSVVIVNFNTRQLLRQCLESLRSAAGGIRTQVVVVDNASSDRSAEMVAECFPEVRLLRNPWNHGYARANNQGSRECGGQYLLLLNSDTVVKPDALQHMTDYLHHHPEVGVVGARLFYGDGRIQGSAKAFPTPLNIFFGRKSLLSKLFPNNPYTRRYLPCLSGDLREPVEVDYVSGAALMVRRALIDRVGPMDEGYFIYWEDADWCYRVRQHGWKVVYLPQAHIVHMEGMSSTRESARLIVEFHKSLYRFFRLHYLPARTKLLTPLVWSLLFLSAAGHGLMDRAGSSLPVLMKKNGTRP